MQPATTDAPATTPPPPSSLAKPTTKEKLERLVAEYGSVAIGTYLGIFVVVFTAFAAAIKLGVHVDSTAGTASLLAAAYGATKLTTPLRLGATVVLTPLVARLRRRVVPGAALAASGATEPVAASPLPEEPPTETSLADTPREAAQRSTTAGTRPQQTPSSTER